MLRPCEGEARGGMRNTLCYEWAVCNPFLILCIYRPAIISVYGDDWLRRLRLSLNCEPRGADLVNSAQTLSANRTNYAALPLAA